MILSEEHKLIQQSVREVALKVIAPLAVEADRNAVFPSQQIKALADLGMLMIKFPEEYGCGGGDYLSYALVMEEVSRECASSGTTVAVQSLSGDCIELFGTEEQKRKYLPKMATCEILGGFALTEPGAGSDAASVATVALDQGDHFLINGTKTFITSGDMVDFVIVVAKNNLEATGVRGLTAFIVDKSESNFTVSKHEDKMGLRGSHTVELVFNDCKVPKKNMLGKSGEGFRVAMKALDGGRIGIAAQAVGILQACLDESIAYSKQRVQFGKPISANQAIQWMIADMAKDLEAARQLVYHACELAGAGLPYAKEAAMAKLFASEAAVKHASNAVQIQGGYGYCKPSKVERLYRDAKITAIYEGTSEVQRMVISGSVLR